MRGANSPARYRDIAELWDTPLDGLIVTGTEPRAADLKDEPYWEALSALVDWARGQHRLDDLVLPCRACGGAAYRRHRTPAAERKSVSASSTAGSSPTTR